MRKVFRPFQSPQICQIKCMNQTAAILAEAEALGKNIVLPGWPHFDDDEVKTVEAILRSGKINYWTGEEGRTFESEYAKFFGVKHAIALANGTLALDLAVRILDFGAGDEVVCTPRTFVASASSAVLQGVKPVFADVDRDSGNLTAETIAAVLSPKTKAVILVHIGGWPCDMEPIMKLAHDRKLIVIEDCAQSHYAKVDGRFAGTFGVLNTWSFCQDKIITTGGEGGMVTTDNDELYERAWSYKDHGKNRKLASEPPSAPGFRYLHTTFGTNFRLTEMQSAIGRVQLRKLARWVAIRRENARILAERLSEIPGIRVPMPRVGVEPAFYRFYAYVERNALRSGLSRDDLIGAAKAEGMKLYSGTCSEIYLERSFQDSGLAPPTRLPVAQELGETALAFLTHPTLRPEHIHQMVDGFEKVYAKLRR